MNKAKDIVKAIQQGDLIGARKAFNDAIIEKIGIAIEARKPIVAQQLFCKQEDPTQSNPEE